MDCKNIMILLLLLLIIDMLCRNNKRESFLNDIYESFGPDVNCGGLATLPDMSCGNYKLHGKGLQCIVDNTDCFMENNIKKCYCKQK